MKNLKTNSSLSPADVKRAARWRMNPIGNLTATQLTRYLDQFEAGYLREAVAVWQYLEERDDLLRTVSAKRKKSVARYGYTVLPCQGCPTSKRKEAEKHKDALEFFYANLTCENALDLAERGGFKLLARQMMDAVGKRYAVHEIVWSPDRNRAAAEGADKRFLTATFRFVPLGFFENTSGKLRFLDRDGALEGAPMADGGWMVTVGDGLMKASSVAWMYKNIALNDWLRASERQGTPALHGSTGATRGSADWEALEGALEDVLEGYSIVTGTGESVEALDLLDHSTLPFPQLVERIDRVLAALWRGADLSTLSRDQGYGASLQDKETVALEEDDVSMLTETLNQQVDRLVIKYVFGEDVEPLAHVRVLLTPRQWTDIDLKIDEFLIRNGAPLSVHDAMLRYGRAMPQPGEEVLHAAVTTGMPSASSRPRPPSAHGIENSSEAFGDRGLDGPIAVIGGPAAQQRGPTNQNPNPVGTTDENPNPVGPRCRAASPSLAGNPIALVNDQDGNVYEWLQLSPLGDFPHSRGLQRVDRVTVANMATTFNSMWERLGRLFGGVPIYAGHPEEPRPGEAPDRKAYGWVTRLEDRENGLWGRVEWSPTGLDLVRNGHYKFVSPYWTAQREGDVLRPARLISVALTNTPNLPVRAIGNEAGNEAFGLVGLIEPHSPELNDSVANELESQRDELQSQGDCASKPGVATKEKPRVDAKEVPNLNEVAPHVPTGPTHTESVTASLAVRKQELHRKQSWHHRVREAVAAKMQLGLSYEEAWEAVKQEIPGFFERH